MSLITKIEAGYQALQAGKQLTKPDIWSQRANLIATLTVLITSCVGLAREFGVELPVVSGTDIASIALGIATLGTILSSVIHTASNTDAGRKPPPPKLPPRPTRR